MYQSRCPSFGIPWWHSIAQSIFICTSLNSFFSFLSYINFIAGIQIYCGQKNSKNGSTFQKKWMRIFHLKSQRHYQRSMMDHHRVSISLFIAWNQISVFLLQDKTNTKIQRGRVLLPGNRAWVKSGRFRESQCSMAKILLSHKEEGRVFLWFM